MPRNADESDPEAILAQQDLRRARQGHAAVAGALTTSALAVALFSLALALGMIPPDAVYPVFMLVAPGAVGGVWLNATLISRLADPLRGFRLVVGGLLWVDAGVFVAALAVGGAEMRTVQAFGVFFAIAWLVGLVATWRFR